VNDGPSVLGPDEHVVVVGAGQGGFQVAASLREAGHAGPVTLIGDEPALPYQRPPLSKQYLAGTLTMPKLVLRGESFFTARDVTVLGGNPAVAIDRGNRTVVLATGERLPYAHLVLATGARPRRLSIPGADLDGVLVLRSVSDADALRSRLAEATRIVVVGAGFVGMEVAAVASGLGHEVTVVEGLRRPLSRSLAAEVSDFVTETHRKRGVNFRLGRAVVALRGAGGVVHAVELDDGERLSADVVVVGIGVVPNTELARESGLDVGDGVVVDERLLTSDPRISALGDCADYPSAHARRRVRLESVQNAVDQARYVAARLAGTAGPAYTAVPWFWTHQYDLRVQMAGIAAADGPRVVRGDAPSGRFSVFRFDADGVLTSVESVNRAADHMAARKVLAAGAPRPTFDEVTARGFDLASYRAA
jgi:3-phenylpropionate/trans-cinnamate dioxygenase ferredoxin reductase subunit